MNYIHLTIEERACISKFKEMNMSLREMITNLKQKNVKFNLITEEAAKEYFKSNNNYYNIALFKHNFQRLFKQ